MLRGCMCRWGRLVLHQGCIRIMTVAGCLPQLCKQGSLLLLRQRRRGMCKPHPADKTDQLCQKFALSGVMTTTSCRQSSDGMVDVCSDILSL